MKFSDYQSSSGQKLSGENKQLLKNLLKNYEGKNQREIIDDIVKIAEEKRRQGTLTDGELDNFYQMLLPMVNAEQKKLLDDVIARLKKL